MTPGGDKGNPTGKLSTAQIFSAIAVDLTMHEQARFLAQQMIDGGMPVWFYRFGDIAESLRPGKMGAEHASELPFMFNTLDTRYPNTVTENDRATARAFHNYVSNFVKTGNPNGNALPDWTKFDPKRSNLMNFSLEKGAVMENDPWKERLDLVQSARTQYRLANSEKTADTDTPSANLGGTSWQLVKFQGGDDTTLTPDDKTKYTITFGKDGWVSVRIDCNGGSGTWKSSGANRLQFGPLALTRAMCRQPSMHDRIAKDWMAIRSYVIKDGHLFLSLMADGGTYEFEPIGGAK